MKTVEEQAEIDALVKLKGGPEDNLSWDPEVSHILPKIYRFLLKTGTQKYRFCASKHSSVRQVYNHIGIDPLHRIHTCITQSHTVKYINIELFGSQHRNPLVPITQNQNTSPNIESIILNSILQQDW
ncbi:unnamed protein product [Schistosoma mattheei]|uniref:Uncharacterized protein n=1 Tax=Schistosoma mattheei TaxID=31246 RepID=A0A183P9R3_9TREM|nr:unnamed protein product [Schistosoma mattheei]